MTQAKAEAILAADKWIENSEAVSLPVWVEKGTRTVRYTVLGAPNDEKLTISIERTDIPGRALLAVTFHLYHETGESLLRLDFGSAHRNPDGSYLDCPHLHRFREGAGDRWAEPWSGPRLIEGHDMRTVAMAFFKTAGIYGETEAALL